MKTEQYKKLLDAIVASKENLINGFGESVYTEYYYWMFLNASNIDLDYYINNYGEDYNAMAEDMVGFFINSLSHPDYDLRDYYLNYE